MLFEYAKGLLNVGTILISGGLFLFFLIKFIILILRYRAVAQADSLIFTYGASHQATIAKLREALTGFEGRQLGYTAFMAEFHKLRAELFDSGEKE